MWNVLPQTLHVTQIYDWNTGKWIYKKALTGHSEDFGYNPPHKVGIEGESWNCTMAGSVRGPFTDASASCEKTEQQLTRLARLISDTFPQVVFNIIAYIICASSIKRLVLRDTDCQPLPLMSLLLWETDVTSDWHNRCDWMFIHSAKARKSTWKGLFFFFASCVKMQFEKGQPWQVKGWFSATWVQCNCWRIRCL